MGDCNCLSSGCVGPRQKPVLNLSVSTLPVACDRYFISGHLILDSAGVNQSRVGESHPIRGVNGCGKQPTPLRLVVRECSSLFELQNYPHRWTPTHETTSNPDNQRQQAIESRPSATNLLSGAHTSCYKPEQPCILTSLAKLFSLGVLPLCSRVRANSMEEPTCDVRRAVGIQPLS